MFWRCVALDVNLGATLMSDQQIQIFTSEDGQAHLEVTLEQETVWLSLDQMTNLFGRDKSVISRHIRNVFIEDELERESVVAKNATTAASPKVRQPSCWGRREAMVTNAAARFCFYGTCAATRPYWPGPSSS